MRELDLRDKTSDNGSNTQFIHETKDAVENDL